MKVAHLVYVLIVTIFVVIATLLYQNSHPVDISSTYVPKVSRLKVVTKHVTIGSDSGSCLGRIDLPAKGKRFLIYFHDSETGNYIDKSIAKITVDDDKGIHILYDSNWGSRASLNGRKSAKELTGRDTVNFDFYREQDNKYYKIVRATHMLKCHIKANYSKSPRIIKITPSYFRCEPTYIKIVQAGDQ